MPIIGLILDVLFDSLLLASIASIACLLIAAVSVLGAAGLALLALRELIKAIVVDVLPFDCWVFST